MAEQKTTSFISVFAIGCLMFCGLVLVGGIIFFYFVLPAPPNRTNFKLYSMDKSQCISVITIDDSRFFINGEFEKVPDSNYIEVDIKNITRLGDEIGVCWKTGDYEWEIVNHRSKIVENKLDTTKYKFNTSWETDERGIPNSKKYHKPNCGTIGTDTMKVYDGNEIILMH